MTIGPKSLESRLPISDRCPTGALSAAEIAPFELNVINRAVGTLGFHASCGIAPFEIKTTCVDPVVKAGPVPANL